MKKQETKRKPIHFPIELHEKILILARKERRSFTAQVVVMMAQMVETRREDWEGEINEG